MRPDREEIESNVNGFIHGACNDNELREVMSDYVEECMDEAYPAQLPTKPRTQADKTAIGVDVYDLLLEANRNWHVPKQVAYQIAKGLLLHYDFYEKE